MSGSMRGMWKRGYGRATKAPPDERGGNRHARPTATAPHPDSTDKPERRLSDRSEDLRGTVPHRLQSADTVEEARFEVIAAGDRGWGLAGERRVASGRGDRRRPRDQLGELAEVLGGSSEGEFVTGAIRPA